MDKQYDVIVLGSGNAGMAAAGTVRAAGKSVAIIEDRDVGGTCPIRGCVPKKVLVAAAEALHQIERAAEHHIQVNGASLDWPALIKREQSFVSGVSEDFAKSLRGRGIDLHKGSAKFVGRDTISQERDRLKGDSIVIATGSYPRPLPIDGAEQLITSEEILSLADRPDSLIFIGGGVIALEFAHVFARAGTKVTILEAAPALLPRFDRDAVDALAEESRRIGIEIYTDVNVTRIESRGERVTLHFDLGGEARVLSADQVANGTGRVPDVERLDLGAGGIEHVGPRIAVDKYLRSVSNPSVYVAGDALWSSAQLSPVATYEGKLVAENVLNGPTKVPDYRAIPASVFSVPALATVGLTESEAVAKGLPFVIKVNDMREWRSARTQAESVAYSKVLLDEEGGRILGAHLVGHGSAEIIHLFAFAMQHGVTALDLKETVYAYPTFASDIKYLV